MDSKLTSFWRSLAWITRLRPLISWPTFKRKTGFSRSTQTAAYLQSVSFWLFTFLRCHCPMLAADVPLMKYFHVPLMKYFLSYKTSCWFFCHIGLHIWRILTKICRLYSGLCISGIQRCTVARGNSHISWNLEIPITIWSAHTRPCLTWCYIKWMRALYDLMEFQSIAMLWGAPMCSGSWEWGSASLWVWSNHVVPGYETWFWRQILA